MVHGRRHEPLGAVDRGVYALAGNGGSADYPAPTPTLYQPTPASLHDVTSGSNGSCGDLDHVQGGGRVRRPDRRGHAEGGCRLQPGSVDTTPPETTIDSGPSGATNDPTPTFGFSSPDPGASFQCRLDSAGFASCSSP